MLSPQAQPSENDLLLEELATFSEDPEGFMVWAFPWGQPGTSLATFSSPTEWQLSVAREISAWIRSGLSWDEAYQKAIASGHGIGKSAQICMLILWAFSTHENTRGIVTANTEAQLRTKTWAELSKWYHLFIAKDLFDLQSTVLCAKDPAHEKTWRIDRVTWSEDNPEAFAGLHNQGSRIIIVFDEASAIPQKIWEVASGALTDANTQILWFAFGNPTLNSGAFFDCFHSRRARWRPQQIDSRSVAITNKREFAKWIDTYGLDSDYVRVRVLGQFPRSSSLEFISRSLLDGARTRQLVSDAAAPLILGVDVARQGDDSSVLYFRRGLDARTIPPVILREANLMRVAAAVAHQVREHRVTGLFVDEGGIGAGVVDRLRQLGLDVHGVQFGAKADLPSREGEGRYRNKRSEMYGSARRWLGSGCIPDTDDLAKELGAPFFSFDEKDQILLEKKKDLKARMGFSPDLADAFVLTFAYPVYPPLMLGHNGGPPMAISDYNPYEEMENA